MSRLIVKCSEQAITIDHKTMKKILIIGAGFLQDFVIRKSRQMGYYTLAVDADPSAIGLSHADKSAVINIIDKESCLQFAKREQIDGVLTAATDYGVLTASYIATHMSIPGLNYETAKLIKNKYLVRKSLFENHVDDTEQTFEVTQDTDTSSLSLLLNYPVMVKPCDGSGSRGASRVDYSEDLVEACEYAMANSITRKAEIESFIVGREYGAESLVIDGEVHVLAIMKKWMTEPPYYAELGHAIPCGLTKEIEERAKKVVAKAIGALGINHGSVNMDLLITDTGKIHIVDVGARMGGNLIGSHIIPYGTGIDYMGNMLRAAVGDDLDWALKDCTAVATKLLAFSGGRVEKSPDVVLESIKKMDSNYDDVKIEVYHHISKGDYVNNYRTNLDGCGYIVARAKDIDRALISAETVLMSFQKGLFA